MTKDCRPIFCSRHLSNTSSTSSTLTSAPRGEGEMGDDVGWSDGEEVVGLHVCTFKSATLSVWQYLCVCVLIFFILEEFVERPRQILSPSPSPGGCSGAWHVDKSSCLSQPCALIRSSTSKDWIMACCPHACRSLPCCRTAGDRQSVLNLWVSGTRRRNKNQKKRFHAVGRRQEDDVFTSTSAQLGCTRTHSAECRRIWCF